MTFRLGVCFGLLALACGPSLREAHQRAEGYERCFAAEYDPSLSPDGRRACWTRWLANRTETDPPERIRYAEARLVQLSIDGSTRMLPDHAPEPAPVYAHRYPRMPPAGHPTSGCTPLCNDRWAACNLRCEMSQKDCVTACEARYRICIQGCP